MDEIRQIVFDENNPLPLDEQPLVGEIFKYTVGKETMTLVCDDMDVYGGQRTLDCDSCALNKFNGEACLACKSYNRGDLEEVIYKLLSTNIKHNLHLFKYAQGEKIKDIPEIGERFYYEVGENTLLLECVEDNSEGFCNDCILRHFRIQHGVGDDVCLPCQLNDRNGKKNAKYKFASIYK